MSYTILNLTDATRSNNPVEGDFLQYTYANGTVSKNYFHEPLVFSESEVLEQKELEARDWRNQELSATDYIVPLTDHPDHAATLAYRVTLRDWPSTSDFPDTKPTL
jgi:hypothetical protein